MRAIVVEEFGHYQDVAKLVDRPIPEPGPNEVLIKNTAAGVSFAASLTVAGKYQRKPPLPFTPSPEYAGIVEKVGSAVTRVKAGDHVMLNADGGGLAGYSVADELCCHKIPADMDPAVGAMLVLSYTTSYGALIRRAGLKAGETLVIHGAAGAVGTAAIEIGKALGATVIAVAGGEKHTETARKHGADYVIDHRKEDFRERVLEITNGRGAEVIYDSIGGEVTHKSLRCIAWEGRLLTIGYACGTIPEIPANLLLLKNVSAMGFNLGHFYGWTPGTKRSDFTEALDEMIGGLIDLYNEGKLKPEVGARFPLHQFHDAMDAVINRTVDGKCVVMLGEEDY